MANLAVYTTFGAIDKMTQPIKSMQTRMNRFAMQANATQASFAAPAKASAVGLGIIGLAVKSITTEYTAFEKSQNSLNAVLSGSAEEMGALAKQARDLGAATVFTASQASDAQFELAKAGFTANEVIGAMPATLSLAAAGALTMGEAASIAAITIRGFGLDAEKDMTRVADVLAKGAASSNATVQSLSESMSKFASNAKLLGVSVESGVAMAGVLQNLGVDASNAGTHVKIMLANVAKNRKAFEKLGIDIAGTVGKGDISGFFKQYNDRLEKIKDPLKRIALTQDLFGRNAAVSAMVLATNNEELRQMKDNLDNAGGTAENMAQKQMSGLVGAFQKLSSAWSEVKLGLAVEGGLADMLAGTFTVITKIFEAFKNAPPWIKKAVVALAIITAAFLVLAPAIWLVNAGLAAMATVAAVVFSPVLAAVAAVIVAAGTLYYIFTLLYRNFEGFKNAVDSFVSKLMPVLRYIGNAMMEGLQPFIDAIEWTIGVIKMIHEMQQGTYGKRSFERSEEYEKSLGIPASMRASSNQVDININNNTDSKLDVAHPLPSTGLSLNVYRTGGM